jgi:hypothetical protein
MLEAKMESLEDVASENAVGPSTGPTSRRMTSESEGGVVQPRHDIMTKLPARLAIIRTAGPCYEVVEVGPTSFPTP